MRIFRVVTENFKKVEFIDITPAGHMVEITGANDSGKTSFIDSIVTCLAGLRNADIPKPVHEGADKAVITVELDDYIIKKIITEKTQRLEVRTRDGVPVKSPQAVLDGFIGKFSFDPHRFYALKPEQQKIELLDMLDIADEVNQLNATIKVLSTNRATTVTARNALQNRLGDVVEKAEKQDVSEEIVKQLEEANQRKLDIQTLSDLEAQSKILAAEWAAVKKKCLDHKARCEELKAKVGEVDDSPLITVQDKIDAINENNVKAIAWDSYLKSLTIIKEHEDKIAAYEADLAKAKELRNDTLAAAEMPLEGMTVEEDGIYFNGIPLKQESTSMQIKISVFLAMKLNPELKVIRISDGSLFDKNSKKIIASIAKKYDYQIWIETVGDDKECGIFIEEGRVVKNEEKDGGDDELQKALDGG